MTSSSWLLLYATLGLKGAWPGVMFEGVPPMPGSLKAPSWYFQNTGAGPPATAADSSATEVRATASTIEPSSRLSL